MTVETIFFDIGGVLAKNPQDVVFSRLNLKMDYDRLAKIRSNHWVLFSLGMMDEKTYWAKLKKDLDIQEDISLITQLARQNLQIDQEVIKIVQELHGNYKLGIISNHSNEWSDLLINNGNLRQYFDPIVISSRVEARKPGRSIFLEAFKQADASPNSSIFIDDQIVNVLAAKQLGMIGIHYENPEQLRRDLNHYLRQN